MTAFVHLNVHSAYSLRSGASRVEEIAARAGAQGHAAIALTDTDGAYGLPAFQTCADAAGVRPIHGAEVHDSSRGAEGRAVLLVEDARGYRNLCRLLTRRRLDERFALSDDLPPLSEGLVVLASGPALLRDLAAAVPRGSLYAEVVAHEPAGRRARAAEAARGLGVPAAGTWRVFFDHPARHSLHRLRLAIGHLKLLREVVPGAPGRDGRPLDLLPKAAFLRPPEEAARAFDDCPGAARATVEIAERCAFRFEKPARPRLPGLEEGPDGPGEAYGRLASLCLDGVRKRYGRLTPEVLSRLERELRVIQDRGFSDYFLIVHGLVGFAKGRGIPCVGRGSAANSIVAYALGITSVDPLRYELPFERFLSPARSDCPDIDVDLDWRGRDLVIEHAYETYGADRVAMISTHVTYQARGALREAAKTLGLAPTEIARMAREVDGGRAPDPLRPDFESMAESGGREGPAVRSDPAGGGDARRLPPPLLRMIRALDGLPNHLSIHPGGIVIGDGPLADSIPLERSAKGWVVTQYDMHGVEATGLVKIDLLGNRALAVVSDTVREARAVYGEEVDLDAVPEEDEKAAALLRTGRTLGCFQVESPGMRNLVVRIDAANQEDAMIALSLIRPGPASTGMKDAYVRRRRGEEPVPSVHPAVDPLFARTYGVMLYQEDTLRVASAVAGFTLEQADVLRRALSKKREPEDLPRMEARFRSQAAERGVPAAVIEEVWSSIRRFSAYSYNKAHAATYGRISWQSLWLKARWPAEWIASVLRNEAGFYPAREYVEEARRLGCRIDLPCVNRSDVGPTGRRGVLRLGLGQVKGLREGTAERLVRVREAEGPYLSLADLLLRVPVEKNEAERLVLAGALDVFDRPRGEVLWTLSLDFERYSRARAERVVRTSLFGPASVLPPPRSIPVPATYSPARLLEMEMDVLGLTASANPFALLEEAARAAGTVSTTDLAAHVGKAVRVGGFVVTDRRVRIPPGKGRSSGRWMKFLMLEDLHGTVEVVLFPKAYSRYGHRLRDAGPFLVTGIVRGDHGALTLQAIEVARLGSAPLGPRAAAPSPAG